MVVEELLKRWWVLLADAIDGVPANWAGIVPHRLLGGIRLGFRDDSRPDTHPAQIGGVRRSRRATPA